MTNTEFNSLIYEAERLVSEQFKRANGETEKVFHTMCTAHGIMLALTLSGGGQEEDLARANCAVEQVRVATAKLIELLAAKYGDEQTACSTLLAIFKKRESVN